MTQEELIARAEELIAAWNQGDVDRIVSAFSAEAREAVRLDAELLLERFPDLELEILRSVAAGHVVTTEWVARTGRDGHRVERTGASVADYDLRGRIARCNRYWGSDLVGAWDVLSDVDRNPPVWSVPLLHPGGDSGVLPHVPPA